MLCNMQTARKPLDNKSLYKVSGQRKSFNNKFKISPPCFRYTFLVPCSYLPWYLTDHNFVKIENNGPAF